MVVFTCNHCGDTLQKPKVAKHYQFRCRKPVFVTCADCLKDFRGEEYIAHIKCISEAERYGGKDYVPKPGANKGERKQQEWICVVNNLLNGAINLSNAERNFLNTLSKFDNVPRKKTKFLNFVTNAMGYRINMTIVESVWDKMETAHKQTQSTAVQSQEADNHKINKIGSNVDLNNSLNDHQENIDNQNNENIYKEHSSALQNGDNEACKTNGDTNETQITKKKSKKRQLIESIETREDQPIAKIKKPSILADTNNHTNEDRKVAFDWQLTILDIVQRKTEISLKKLQKKVISRYLLHSMKNVEQEKVIAKFHKKLKKIPEIIVSDSIVKLNK